MVSSSQKLFERRGDRWDTLGLGKKDPIAQALREIADRHERYQRGYDAGPGRKPRYDGAAMYPQPRSVLPCKPRALVERDTRKGIEARRYMQQPCDRRGMDFVDPVVVRAEPDLVKMTTEQLDARIEAGRSWIEAEKAANAARRAERAKKTR